MSREKWLALPWLLLASGPRSKRLLMGPAAHTRKKSGGCLAVLTVLALPLLSIALGVTYGMWS